MKPYRYLFPLLCAVLSAPTFGDTASGAAARMTAAPDADAGLAVVKTLGTVNGEALACAESKVAARARELMLAHAPKTPRFGAAYEDATQEAFKAQTQTGKTCASTTEFTARLNQLALQLSATLPVTAK